MRWLISLAVFAGLASVASAGTGRILYTGLDPSLHFPDLGTVDFARNAVVWAGGERDPKIGYVDHYQPGSVAGLLTTAGFTDLTELTDADLIAGSLGGYDVLYIGVIVDPAGFLGAEPSLQAYVDAGGALVVEAQAGGADSWSWLPYANAIGHTGSANPCNDGVRIIDPCHPVMSGLTDADLSNWDCSSHSQFATPEFGGFIAIGWDSDDGVPNTIVREPTQQLLLNARPPIATLRELVTFTSYGGTPGNPVVLFVSGINCVPLPLTLINFGTYNAAGIWSLTGPVPNFTDLLNNDFALFAFTIDAMGDVISTNEAIARVE